ncbi:DUF4011 domain-containing protein [Candidatus Ruminimicrobiellum ovillum]|uniref:DUF4011 domain-containing protein n=2 Tax=Candidatus Ruminimicrobiellum ovillum TaxID=1947927 RepID=UPI00355ABA4B
MITENTNNEKTIEKRIYKWKEKLIDLSKRNRLLNFKFSKSLTLRIIDEQPPEIYKALVRELHSLEFLPIKENAANIPEQEKKPLEELNEGIEFRAREFKEYTSAELSKKHTDKYLQTKLSVQDLNKVLNKISTTARSTNDDLGYNVLFLALGSVIWYEKDSSNEPMEAPVLLVPVEIKRKSIGQPFTVKYNEDSVILNPALILKLKRDFGINLEDIAIDEEEINPIDIFIKVQNKISKNPRWKLLNNIYIGLFSFAKFVMYKDLEEHQAIIKRNNFVETICGLNDNKQVSAEDICPISELDNIVHPHGTYQILDADSSQQQAIQVVKSGNNLIIEGPPGTGKSQTIANMIGELLAQNKKVLFVSQKIAALEVVKNRLAANGLAPFCLELHSNKTNRKNVLGELAKSLDYKFVGNYDSQSLSKILTDIKSLKVYSKELHTPAGLVKISPYKAIGIVLDNNHIPEFRYIFENYDKWTDEDLSAKKELFKNATETIKKLGNPKDFAWYGTQVRELSLKEKMNLKTEIDYLIKSIDEVEKNINFLCEELLLKKVTKISQIEDFITVADSVSNISDSALSYMENTDINFEEDVKLVRDTVKQFTTFNNRIKNKYNSQILNQDIDDLISKLSLYGFVSKLFFKFNKNYNFFKQFFINNHKPGFYELLYDLNNIKELKKSTAELDKCDNIAAKLYSQYWNKNNPDDNDIKRQCNRLLKFKELIREDSSFKESITEKIKNKKIDYKKVKIATDTISQLQEPIKTKLDIITDILKFDWNKAFACQYSDIDINALKNKFSAVSQKADDLTLWIKHLDLTDEIEKEGLTPFWNKCVEANLSLDDYSVALETEFLRIWLMGYVFENNDILKNFNSLEQDDLVKEFKNLDKGQIVSAKDRLVSKLSSNINFAKQQYPKEVSELKRLCKLQRIRKSLRQIIRSVPKLFLELKPCLMMSPSTVAQLLDPNIFHFDVVVFDEASQLTTEDCIGSIIRGSKLVVTGDTKQLPPTSFFRTVLETDEEEIDDEQTQEQEREDLDSILDECTTSGFPQCMLKWHYRSKHEHLIAFSNKHLYQDLYTFPNCIETSDTLGVKFNYHIPTPATKEEMCSEEAKIVAKAVMQHAKNHPNMSLGVATLNIKQKSLIENEIEKLREQDPSCEDFFNNSGQEYFFVKNLESVQGDERDVIMISVGYFKNKNGILSMNFGPINQDGGERRLNVLVTRSRYKIEVFSGIKASDFNLEKTSSTGVKLLQAYLDFAEKGESSLNKKEDNSFENNTFVSPFEESVYKALTEKGYLVSSQVGCSNYKIDLAVRDKNNPNKFLAGIECDGPTYNSCATIRDRDRLRQEVLERLGWKMYRIWSTDWFKNPKEQLEKLTNFIDNVKN